MNRCPILRGVTILVLAGLVMWVPAIAAQQFSMSNKINEIELSPAGDRLLIHVATYIYASRGSQDPNNNRNIIPECDDSTKVVILLDAQTPGELLQQEMLLKLIEAVGPQTPELAATLARWVQEFEYERVMDLVGPEQ